MAMRFATDPNRQNLGRQALAGASWSALQKLFTRGASLLTFVVLGRLLAPEDFGLVAASAATIAFVTSLFDFSIHVYLVQQVDLERRSIDTTFWIGMIMALAVTGVVAGCAPLLSRLYDEPALTPVLIAMVGVLPISALSGVPLALLKRSLSFRVIAARSAIGMALSAITGVSLAYMGAGVWALVAGSYVLNLASLLFFYGLGGWRPRFAWDMAEARRILRYGSTLWGINILVSLRDKGDLLVLALFLSTTDLGIYMIATRVLAAVLDIVKGVVYQVIPAALAAAKQDTARVHRGYLLGLTVTATVVVPATVALAMTSDTLVPTVFGDQWLVAGDVAQICTIALAATAFAKLERGLYLALDRPRVELTNVAVTTVMVLAAVLVAAPFGLLAVAVGTTIVSYVSLAWRWVVIVRRARIGFRRIVDALAPATAAGLATGAFGWAAVETASRWSVLTPQWEPAVVVSVMLLVYPLMLRVTASSALRQISLLVPNRLWRTSAVRPVLWLLFGTDAVARGARTAS